MDYELNSPEAASLRIDLLGTTFQITEAISILPPERHHFQVMLSYRADRSFHASLNKGLGFASGITSVKEFLARLSATYTLLLA